MSDTDSDSDEIIFLVETSEDESTYVITMQRVNKGRITPNEFITEVEMWLHEVTRAEIAKRDPDTKTH